MLLFSHSVMSNCLRPHGLQHARHPCPSPFPRACSISCPLSRWCHPTISSSIAPFFSYLQSFPVSGSFLMNLLYASGAQSIRASASASVLPMNIQDWLAWSPCCPRDSQELPNTTVQNPQFFTTQPSLWSDSHPLHDYWKKTIALTRRIFVGKVMSLLLNMLSRLFITFLLFNYYTISIVYIGFN